jgi:hypothetical protein
MREGDGGEFYFRPEKGACLRIKIGGDYKEWSQVVRVLLHEVVEAALTKAKVRYAPSEDMSCDSATYLFCFTHSQMSDALGVAASFLVEALPDLSTAWKKWKKRKHKT